MGECEIAIQRCAAALRNEVVGLHHVWGKHKIDRRHLHWLRNILAADYQIRRANIAIESRLVGRSAGADIGIEHSGYLHPWIEGHTKGRRQLRQFCE